MNAPKFTAPYGELFAGLSVEPGVILASAAVMLAGAVAGSSVLRRGDPAATFAAGMGGYVLLSTLLGVFGVDLRVALGLAVAAVVAAGAARRDWLHRWGGTLALMGLAALPLLLLSDRQGSEWDEFSHWLHAFRYLAANNALPGGPDAPPMGSCCAAYPYAWPMIGYAAMKLAGFSEAVPVMLNILVLALFAILLVEAARREAGMERAGPGLLAAGLLAATVASPSFVHKLAFSAYADIATAFLVAVLAVAGERMIAPPSSKSNEKDSDEAVRWAVAFGLTGAALLAVKPGNAALFGCILGGSALVGLRRGGWAVLGQRQWLAAILLPLICAGLWRWHVGRYLTGQELTIRPLGTWNLGLIPDIVRAMADVASQKGGHFGLGLIVLALGLIGFVRCRDRLDRLAAVAGLLFVGYNLFLLSTYVAVFGPVDAVKVVSFWRYNTHVGLALMVPAAMVAGRLLGRFKGRGWMRGLGWLAMVLVVAGPPALLPQLRFDVDPMKTHIRQSLRLIAQEVPRGEAMAVIDMSGSGLSWVMAGYEWDGKLKYTYGLSAFSPVEPLPWLNARSVDWAYVVSGQARMGLEPNTASLLIHREGGSWTVFDQFDYPGKRIPARYP